MEVTWTRRAGLIPSGLLPKRASQDKVGWGMGHLYGWLVPPCQRERGLPRKVTQSHPHPTAEETGIQRGRDLPKDTRQSHGWRHSPGSQPGCSLPYAGGWSQNASQTTPRQTHTGIGGDRRHWTCPQNLPLLAELPMRYKPLVAGAVSPTSLESP